ncbi:MAG: hypothetical protein EOO64_01575 [Massilia sp.]|nr:MAG: hypothetical protein EOO64_01575 [Massilia sp.]
MKWRIEVREPDRLHGYLVAECGVNSSNSCRWSISRLAVENGRQEPGVWQWDGNVDAPTLSPSIFCHGGCNRHFTMVAGVPIGET